MVYAQAGASGYSSFFSGYLHTGGCCCRQAFFYGFFCEDDAAREVLHKDGEVVEVRGGIFKVNIYYLTQRYKHVLEISKLMQTGYNCIYFPK